MIGTGHQPPVDEEVVVIGAGLAGICAGIKLAEANIPYTILEAANDIGGTWRANIYPGVQVDVPSVAYSYSFEPNPAWSRVYAPGAELREYINRCADKYQVRPHVRLQTEVIKAVFDATHDRWRLELADGAIITARHVIAGWGALARPKLPDIPGIDTYTGRVVHTAAWDADHDLRGERVAVIGTGASGVQLVPQLVPTVSELEVFQRTPVWVLPRPDFAIPRPIRKLFRALPPLQHAVRLICAGASELLFIRAATNYRQMPQLVSTFERLGRWWLRQQVRDPQLRARLTPHYGLGCKRPTLSNTYLSAFNHPNVTLVTNPIERATQTGLVTTDGVLHEFHTIVFATGFKVFERGGAPPIEVIGDDGTELGRFWEESRYQSFEGVSVPRFPNLYLTTGPYALAGPSYIFMIETNVRHAVRCIIEAHRRRATRVAIRQTSHDAYFQEILRRQRDTVFFNNNCSTANSYYFDHHGDAPILRPASGLEMWRHSHTFDLNHYTYTNGARPQPG